MLECQKGGKIALAFTHDLYGGGRQPRISLRYIDIKFCFTRFTFFRGNQDYTVTGTRTIKRGRSCIFEHLHGFDAGRIETRQGIDTACLHRSRRSHGYTVNDIKGRTIVDSLLVERGETTDGDLRTTTAGGSAQVGDFHTGHAALQQIFNAGGGGILDLIAFHTRNRTHQITLAAFTISNHLYLTQSRRSGFEGYAQGLAKSVGYALSIIA